MFRKFEMPPHLRELVEVLEAVERGEERRVLISMPPRHGKSLITSQIFPAWFLGKHPDKNVIVTSYGSELATDFGKRVRNFVRERVHTAIFPECVMAADAAAISRFTTTAGGSFYATGAGGPITGRGAI